jgi:FkbM family methyltransferase
MTYKILKLADDLYAYKGYFLPYPHFSIDVFYHKYSLNNIENIEKLTGTTIVDIGAYLGDSSILFYRELKPCRMVIIEPTTHWANQIRKTLEINNIKNCKIIQCAVGDKLCNMEISVDILGGCSGFMELTGSEENKSLFYKENVKVDKFDNIMHNENITNLGMIKIDIEGYERYFLRGAEKSIRKFKPVILISIYHSWDDFCDLKTIIEEFNLGYKFKIVKVINNCLVLESLLIAEII